MERQATILDVLISPTGKWIVIFIGVIIFATLIYNWLDSPRITQFATKVLPNK